EAFGVTFEKNSKEYILKLNTKKDLQTNNYVTPGGSEAQGSFDVHKGDINFYRKNPSKIWKDIAINEVFEGKKIKGFRVDRIAPNSKMARLGLKKGDVIIRANNRELNSYKAAIDLYKNIDNIDTMALTVLRNNQEKELIYEIR
ncbi:MAG: PDZ domain-containing protein, partial [Sulfurimonas sp.]